MSSSAYYVSIRDDSGLSSLSVNERDFLRTCALRGIQNSNGSHNSAIAGAAAAAHDDDNEEQNHKMILRSDGRRGNDVRKTKLTLRRWDNGAEATVQWGVGTRVSAVCTASLVPPFPDRPNEGMVSFQVDLSPMASPSFRLAPPVTTGGGGMSGSSSSSNNYSNQEQRLLSNRLVRCLERILILGGALDTEALVLEVGKWVWKFNISLTVLDSGGNIMDACVLAAVAALRHYRKPQVELSTSSSSYTNNNSSTATTEAFPTITGTTDNDVRMPTMIPSTMKEATPLPLHHSPLSISFGLIPADDAVHSSTTNASMVAALIDPTDREELVTSGTLTIAMNIHGEVCLLDYGGGCELLPHKLKECCQVAKTAIQQACQFLESTLTLADEQAQADRLRRLQLQQQQQQGADDAILDLPPLPSSSTQGVAVNNNIPFFQQFLEEDQLDVVDTNADIDLAQVQQIRTAAEETYRKQALDYASLHRAMDVREDKEEERTSQQQASSLLAAMLRSVKLQQNVQEPKAPPQGLQLPPVTLLTQPLYSQTVLIHDATRTKTAPKKEITESLSPPSSQENIPIVPNKLPRIMDLDSEEEEETTMVLESEFATVGIQPQNVRAADLVKPLLPPSPVEATATVNKKQKEEEPDIDDLSMAIKSKKNKKKKSKK